MHRVLVPHAAYVVGTLVTIEGEEATHAARVKRVRIGEVVGLLDGAGTRALGVMRRALGKGSVEVEIQEVMSVPRPAITVDVVSAIPKGDRVEWMIEQLVQVGVRSWRPLVSEYTDDDRSLRRDRLDRIARESLKQCGRAWFMDLGGEISFDRACELPGAVVADMNPSTTLTTRSPISLIIGPEGGFSSTELDRARSAGVAFACFGIHTMRTETAAVVGGAICMLGDLSNRTHGG